MKKLYLIFAVLVCLVFISACSNKEPVIEIGAKVSSISDKESHQIGFTENLIEPKQEDFKIFEFNFNMEHTNSVKERKIVIYDNWIEIFNNIDEINRYNNGSGYSQDNESENFAKYYQKVVFYAKGLSNGDIRKAFKDYKITVSWTNTKNETIKKEYDISDQIEFSSNK